MPARREGTGLRKWMERGWSPKNHLSCSRSLKRALPAWTPTSRGLRPLPLCPHPTLTFVTGAGGEQEATKETAAGSWRGVGRAGPGARPEPGALWSTLGKGCRGSPKRGGGRGQGSRAETERSLPPTLVHTAVWADPNLGVGRGNRQWLLLIRSGAGRPHSLIPPHPRYCGMTSARPGAD